MPTDPRILLSGAQQQQPDPLEYMSRLMQLEAQRENLATQREYRGAMTADRHAMTQQRQLELQKAQEEASAQQQAMVAIDMLRNGQGRELLSQIRNPQAAMAAEAWLDKRDKMQAERDKLKRADLQSRAQLIRETGYDPQIMETVIGDAARDMPEVGEVWEKLKGDPEKLRRVIDHYAGVTAKPGEGQHVLNEGAVLVGPKGEVIARGNPKTDATKGKWVPDYDETGKPIERWVAEGPGAVAPREVEAPRPVVVSPGAKVLDPVTREVIAEGNPIERATASTAVIPVETVNAAGEPVTKLVERTPGQEFVKPPAAVTRPRDVAPGSKEAFFIAFAQKLGKRPDELTLDEQSKALQSYSRADDKPERPQREGGSSLSPTMEANVINRLSNQWTAASKPARELDRQVDLMRVGLKAAERGDMNAGSQAVIATFNKILDPNSVVREAEYERTAAGQSLMNRVRGAFEKLSQGGAKVPLAELQKFAQLAEEAAKAQRGSYLDRVKGRLGLTADKFRIPRELVFEAEDPNTGVRTVPQESVTSAPAGPAGLFNYQDYLKRKKGAK